MTLLQRCCCNSRRILRSNSSIHKYAAVALRFIRYEENSLVVLNRHSISQQYGTTSSCNSFFNQSAFTDKTKEYKGRKLVGFSMDQMYEVVSDVDNYKKFVPFCKRSEVTQRKPGYLKGELSIGFPPINESYVSEVTLIRPRLVKAECSEGHLFDHLTTIWKFSPGLSSEPQSCVIDFYVSFKFRSSLHSQLAHVFFNELVRQMERAFFAEAQQRFGKPSIHTLKLEVTNQSKPI